jgi:hypothetical protein
MIFCQFIAKVVFLLLLLVFLHLKHSYYNMLIFETLFTTFISIEEEEDINFWVA